MTEVLAQRLCIYLFSGFPAYYSLQKAASWLEENEYKDASGEIISIHSFNFHGDPFMKALGIYTGDDLQTLNWWQSQ